MKVEKDFYEDFEIDLSTLCNLDCPLCTRNYEHSKHLFNGPKNGRSLQEIIEQLDKFPNLKHGSIAGMISEPTLYKDFIPFIEYLKSRNISLDIHTNGDTHNDKFWKEVSNLLKDEDIINLTVCGSTQELHEKYRVGSKLERVLEVARILKDSCNSLNIQVIIFEYNKDNLDEILYMLEDLNLNGRVEVIYSEGLNTVHLSDFINPPTEDISPPYTQRDILKSLRNIKYGKGGKIDCMFYNMRKITINNDGTEYACHVQSEFKIPFHYDYKDIFEYKYNDCLICELTTQTFLSKLRLDGIS